MSETRRLRKDYKDHARGTAAARDKERDRPKDRVWNGDGEKSRERRQYSWAKLPTSRRQSRRHHEEVSDTSSTSSSATTPRRRLSPPHRSASASTRPKDITMSVPRIDRRVTSGGSYDSRENKRTSMPYPGFSRPHSKEAVTTDKIGGTGTPISSPTHKNAGRGSPGQSGRVPGFGAPPSPPLTVVESNVRHVKSRSSMRHISADHVELVTLVDAAPSVERRGPRFSASRTSLREAEEGEGGFSPALVAPQAMATPQYGQAESQQTLRQSSARYSSCTDSGMTCAHPLNRPADRVSDSVLRGLSQSPEEALSMCEKFPISKNARSAGPLPVSGNRASPIVDFLLENGGLDRALNDAFAAASRVSAPHVINKGSPTTVTSCTREPTVVDKGLLFAPYHGVLDDLAIILTGNGSVAVSTGYRPSTQRALDKLATTSNPRPVARLCRCIMCRESDRVLATAARESTTWIRALDYISGRRPLPAWPPFTIPVVAATTVQTPNPSSTTPPRPMQSMDVDVPSALHEQYARQSRKTAHAVHTWLAHQPAASTQSASHQIEDEALTFAMMTRLDEPHQGIFSALTGGFPLLPFSTSLAPVSSSPSAFATTLQHLHRLPLPPRAPEATLYLLLHPDMHDTLATLSSLSPTDWILVRAELTFAPTPSSYPNEAHPGTDADHAAEAAALHRVEREIYAGMSALEDDFEALHVRAESVRSALVQRVARLHQAQSHVPVTTPTPAVSLMERFRSSQHAGLNADGNNADADVDVDDGIGDARSELAPDDSASNIGFRVRQSAYAAEARARAQAQGRGRGVLPVRTRPQGGVSGSSRR